MVFRLTRSPPSRVSIMHPPSCIYNATPFSCIFLDHFGELWQPREVSFNGFEFTKNSVISMSYLGPHGLSWPEKGSLLQGPGPALEPPVEGKAACQ